MTRIIDRTDLDCLMPRSPRDIAEIERLRNILAECVQANIDGDYYNDSTWGKAAEAVGDELLERSHAVVAPKLLASEIGRLQTMVARLDDERNSLEEALGCPPDCDLMRWARLLRDNFAEHGGKEKP